MIIVSSCLVGIKCRYDGSDNCVQELLELMKKKLLLPICPEQLGGLPTPRNPAEILDGKVYDFLGNDVTANFEMGAQETLRVARLLGCKRAILKDGSPSCGVNRIYNGRHEEITIRGEGITTSLLRENGIEVYSEKEIKKAGIF